MRSNNILDESIQWWAPEYGFFGEFYMNGDNSKEGYLEQQQNLAERTETEVEGVIRLLAIKAGGVILDCPCGYGRHSALLAQKGFEVVGSDINPVHLQKALLKKSDRLELTFNTENMLDLNYENQFDAVINMFYSFGFFESDQENEQVVANFYNALKKGGKFLMHTDVNIPRIEKKLYKEDENRTLQDGSTLRIIDKYNPVSKRIEGRWIIKKTNGEEEQKDYSVRVYTAQEFTDVCKKIGFEQVEIYSDWNGSEYSADSEDMMVVATK